MVLLVTSVMGRAGGNLMSEFCAREEKHRANSRLFDQSVLPDLIPSTTITFSMVAFTS